MRYSLNLVAVLSVLAFALVGCGSSKSSASSASAPATATSATNTTANTATSTTSTTKFAKTKFVLHAGLAFGAFHRWIYKPAKAGELTHPLQHKLTTVKAALAAAFVYHQLKLALADAQADPTLSHLVAPITDLQNKFHDLTGRVKSGGVSADDAGGLDGAISSIKSQAQGAGQPITEQTPATPSG
ncbi:MAG: hypothetical protein JO363_17795 [Solirubrobacterales bacterium]|nr:hypothetical protein [Solirubrobacterales bacterium]